MAGPSRDPALYAAATMRLVEDYDDLAALQEEAARELHAPAANPGLTDGRARQREILSGEARYYREELIRTVQLAIERAPNASVADQWLFRMAVAQTALARLNDARHTYLTLLQRFPQSLYVPHAYLAFADHYFAERAWEPAAQFYERARLPADATNHARAYALYRLAWARRLADEPAVALVHFDQALAWAAEHPDAPDVARLAEVAREERAALATRIAPSAPRPLRRRAAPAR